MWNGPASAVHRSALHRVRDTVTEMGGRFFVYFLANRPLGVLYVGVTNDLIRRLAEHKAKLVPGFTKTYGVIMLVYYEEYSSSSRSQGTGGSTQALASSMEDCTGRQVQSGLA